MKNRKNKSRLKILAAGDIHGDSSLTKKLADKAEKEKVDLVILSGDLTSHIETKNLIKPFKEKDKKVLLLHGNWDCLATTDFLAEFYGMKNIHGYSLKTKDIGIFGAGGTPSTKHEEEEIFKTLEKASKKIKDAKKKIMITHMHPEKTISEFSGFPGSKGIRKAINKLKPDFLIHSHIHEAEGIEEKIGKTKIINIGRKGKIIEI